MIDYFSGMLPWHVEMSTVMHTGAVVTAAVSLAFVVALVWRLRVVSAVAVWAVATIALSVVSSGFGPSAVFMGTTATLGLTVIFYGLGQYFMPLVAARRHGRR